ncbi:MAG TPA: stalk domain-containing protein, partial [Peptococcaceae bacterium]|nr:stalk domain-containing protein [Peptococcaceae bacterium]
RIGEENYRVKTGNKEELKQSDVAPLIQNSRTLLPLRALAESLDFKVDWIGEEKKVEIKEKPGTKRKLLSPEEWATFLKQGGNTQ